MSLAGIVNGVRAGPGDSPSASGIGESGVRTDLVTRRGPLYFVESATGQDAPAVMSVDVTVEPDGFSLGSPVAVFDRRPGFSYKDIHPDGDRFLAIDGSTEGEEGALRYQPVVTLNWFEDLRQRFAELASQ